MGWGRRDRREGPGRHPGRRVWRGLARRNVDDDVHDEVAFHIEMRTRDNVRAGMDPEAARREAERRFGDRARVEGEVTRILARSERRRRAGERLAGLARDLRVGARSLRRRPGFTAAVVLTLALGIGATTAIFSVAHWSILRPVPGVAAPDEIVTIRFERERTAGQGLGWFFASHLDVQDLMAGAPAFTGVSSGIATQAHVRVPGAAAPQRVHINVTMPGYFRVLGVTPALGRVAEPGAGDDPRQVVLSHALWRDAFGADPAALGRTLEVNGRSFTVVGVAPAEFRGPTYPMNDVAAWIPVEAHADVMAGYGPDVLADRDRGIYFDLLARLAPGATPEVAGAQLRAARDAIVGSYQAGSSLERVVPIVTAGTGLMPWVREGLTGMLRVLAAVVALLLLLAASNAANLVLARAHGRRHELAVRRAIGAGRFHLVRQLVSEGALLGVAAGALGLLLARLLLAAFEGQRLGRNLPQLGDVPLDGPVLLFAAGTALLTGILFSLVPALLAARSAEGTLRSGARTAGGDGRLRGALVAVQVALSLGLLAGAGLLLDSLRALGGMELGFETRGAVEMTLDAGTQGYDEAEVPDLWRALLASVRAEPGVEAAGFAWAPVHGNVASDTEVWPVGTAEDEGGVSAHSNQVSEGYLAALGIDLLAGRDFLPEEVMATPPANVLLVSESVARELAPDGQVLGMEVAMTFRDDATFRIVGVTADVRRYSAKDGSAAMVLEPMGQQWTPGWGTIYARTRGSAAELARRLPGAVARVDPALPPYDVMTLETRAAVPLAEDRMLARLTTLFAVLAVVLAGVGLYAVMAFSVAARAREFGVRLALGAGAGSVREMVLRQGLRRTAVGVVAGLGVAYAIGRLLAARLWGVLPTDPWVLGTAAATLLVVGAVASWLPAWRATRVDPVQALRSE